MILRGRDDSSFLVPWPVWSPKQMTFISGWTAGIGPPKLDTRNERKTRGEERGRVWRSAEIPHLLLQSSCLADEWFFLGLQDPRALEGHVQTDISGFFFPCGIILLFKRFDFYVLICLRWLTYISSPCSETFFGTWMWSNYRTVWSNTTFNPNCLHGSSQNQIIVQLTLQDSLIGCCWCRRCSRPLLLPKKCYSFLDFFFFFFLPVTRKCHRNIKSGVISLDKRDFSGIQAAFPSSTPSKNI